LERTKEAHEKSDRDSRIGIYALAWSDTVLGNRHSNPGAILPEQREAMQLGISEGRQTVDLSPDLPSLLLAEHGDNGNARRALEDALLKRPGMKGFRTRLAETEPPTTIAPHRKAGHQIEYVCIVCFDVAPDVPANCTRDKVPLAPVACAETVAELRGRVGRLTRRREAVRTAIVFVIGFAISLVLCLTFDWKILPSTRGGLYSGAFAFVGTMASIVLGPLSYGIAPMRRGSDDLAALLKVLSLDSARNSVAPDLPVNPG
jgi:hypothetical protein